MIGKTISQYHILEKLGEGGMGVVYKAEDVKLKRVVALKFLPHHIEANDAEKSRFLQEAQAASALNHPNVCTIYDIKEEDGQQFIVMEFIDGVTLRKMIPVQNFSEAITYAIQIAEALQEAHAKGIVHRDVKADNIMVNSKGQIKVMDFGLAKLKGSMKLTRTSSTVGTLAYMSPEQIQGGEVDARSDIFSFGVVLYEMLTGQTPFRGEHEAAMLYSIVNELPQPITNVLPDAPADLIHVLNRSLEKDPNDRYQSMSDVVIELRRMKKETTRVSRVMPLGVSVSQERPFTSAVRDIRPETTSPISAGAGSRKKLALGLGIAGAIVVAGFLLYKTFASKPNETNTGAPLQTEFSQLTDFPGVEAFPAYSPDGNYIAYTKQVGKKFDIFLLRVGGGNPIDITKDIKESNSEPSYSPDGQWIAFRSESDGGGIYIMGATGESVRRLTDLGFNPVWSPDGSRILCATENVLNPDARLTTSQLWSIDVKSGEKKMIFKGDAVQPSWSPHGSRIAYWALPDGGGQRDIWTIPAEGGTPVAVTSDPAVDWNPIWSPDGEFLYFSSDRGGSMNFWRAPIDEMSGKVTGELQPITTPSGWTGHLSATRDGKRIAYLSFERKANIMRVAFDPVKEKTLGEPSAVTQGARVIATIDVSPNGQYLAFFTTGKQENICVARIDGTDIRQLTNDAFKNRRPRWSPDGRRILFYSNRGVRYEIWCINADGSGLEQLTQTSGSSLAEFNWLPDGNHIIGYRIGEGTVTLDLTKPLSDRQPELQPPLKDSSEIFTLSSVSPDGKYLAGTAETKIGGNDVPGLFTYSMETKTYTRLPVTGKRPVWCGGNQKLVYANDDSLWLIDLTAMKPHEILAPLQNAKIVDFCISNDGRAIYFTSGMSEGDIWQVTMK